MIILCFRDDLEDPLDDLGMVQQQLEQLSVIERCEYEKTCALLVQLFDQVYMFCYFILLNFFEQNIDLQRTKYYFSTGGW